MLIDAENVHSGIAGGLFAEISKLGEACVRRIYGDFTGPLDRGWIEILARYAIEPRQQFACATGKNAADIALVIDAMDLLHAGRLDGFCIVSSDSDFSRLATRLREQGADVYGFGEKKTPESFRQACRRFISVESLMAPAAVLAHSAPTPITPGATGAVPVVSAAMVPKAAADAGAILVRLVSELGNGDGWASLGQLGSELAKRNMTLDRRSCGAKTLSDLVRMIHALELRRAADGGMLVRIRAPAIARQRP